MWFSMNQITNNYVCLKNRWEYKKNIMIVNGYTKDFVVMSSIEINRTTKGCFWGVFGLVYYNPYYKKKDLIG